MLNYWKANLTYAEWRNPKKNIKFIIYVEVEDRFHSPDSCKYLYTKKLTSSELKLIFSSLIEVLENSLKIQNWKRHLIEVFTLFSTINEGFYSTETLY